MNIPVEKNHDKKDLSTYISLEKIALNQNNFVIKARITNFENHKSSSLYDILFQIEY